jgi:hypothetical protein
MACSTENEPGLWRGGKAYEVLRHERLRRQQHEGMLDEPPHIVAGFVLGVRTGPSAE